MIKRIGDIISISSGGTPKRDNPLYYQNGTIPWVKTGDLKGKYSNYPSEFITEDALKNSSAKIFPKGTVLLAMYGATIGECSILNFDAATNQACAALLPNKDVDENYLYYFLSSYKSEFIKLGVGGAQPNISAGIIKNIQIPLPSLSEQKRIADLLDAADSLRQKDKALLQKYDQLAQSLFLDMFGDPMKNEKGWEKKEIKKIAKVITGQTPPSSLDHMFGGEIPFVTPGDLDSDKEVKRTLTSERAKKSRLLRTGGLFVCCIGATIGKMNLAKNESAFNQQINGIDWSNEINDLFGFFATKAIKNDIIDNSISTTLPILKKSEFEKLKIIVPEISFQNQFAEQVQRIENQKALAKKNLEKSEALFGGLMGEVFKKLL